MEDDKKHLGGKRRDVLAGMRGRDAEEGGSLLEDVLRAMRRLAHDGAVADDRLCKNQAMAERSRFGIRGVAEDLARDVHLGDRGIFADRAAKDDVTVASEGIHAGTADFVL